MSFASDFESYSTGVLPTGWANKVGTWAVAERNPVSGTKALANTSAAANDIVLYTGDGVQADGVYTFDQKIIAQNTIASMSYCLRMSADAQNGYVAIIEYKGSNGWGIDIYDRVSGSQTSLYTSAAIVTGTAIGDVLHSEIKIVGTQIEARLWVNSASRPSSPSFTHTDTKYASGYPGIFCYSYGFRPVSADNVNFTQIAAPAVALTGPSTVQMGATATFTATLNQTSASATTIPFSDSAAGGTFTPASVVIAAGQTVGTSQYSPASTGSKSISITADNGYAVSGSPISLSVTAANATSLTLSGASSAPVNTGVTLTVTLNGPAGAATSITFSDTASSTFSVNPLVIAAGATSGTVTFTPTVVGAHSISVTNNQGLSQSGSPLSFTASAVGVSVAVTDSNWYWSPYTWDTVSGKKRSNCGGAYSKLGFTGTSVSVGVDVSALVSASVSAGQYPVIAYKVDNKPSVKTQLTSGTTSLSVTGLSAGSHVIETWLESAYVAAGAPDLWTTPINALVITGATIDSGASTVAPTVLGKNLVVFGDSITVGQYSLGVMTEITGTSSAAAYTRTLAAGLGAEYGQIGFAGQGFINGGSGNVPTFNGGSHSLYSAGRSRLVGGVLSPAPDYVVLAHGTNGSPAASDVTTAISALRSIAPSSSIYVCVPFGRYNAAAITTGFNNYVAANPADTKIKLIDIGVELSKGIDTADFIFGIGSETDASIDGCHPKQAHHAKIAAAIASRVDATVISGGAGTYPTASQVLTGVSFGPTGSDYTGNVTLPAANKVRTGTSYGASGTQYSGSVTLPTAAQVQSGVAYGAGGNEFNGTYTGGVGGTYPAANVVLTGNSYGPNGNDYTGTVALPSVSSVLSGVTFGAAGVQTGTITLPAVGDVRSGTQYGASGTQYTGTLSTSGGGGTYPAASQVIFGVSYGPSGSDYTGNVTLPSAGQVQAGVGYGAAGTQYVGLLTTGGVVAAGQVPNGRYLRVGA